MPYYEYVVYLATMNVSDIAGMVFIVIGLLCILATAYLSPVFLIVSGGFLSAGIVLMITAGNMCRAQEDVNSGKDQVYATLKLDDKPGKKTTPITVSLTPPLVRIHT